MSAISKEILENLGVIVKDFHSALTKIDADVEVYDPSSFQSYHGDHCMFRNMETIC